MCSDAVGRAEPVLGPVPERALSVRMLKAEVLRLDGPQNHQEDLFKHSCLGPSPEYPAEEGGT